MIKKVASKLSHRPRTIGEAAEQLGIQRKQLKFWLIEFPIFDDNVRKHFSESDFRAAQALKRLLIEECFSVDEVHKLFHESGVDAVIAAYGVVAAQTDSANPALALQSAVRSAAAAGFFGPVVAELDDATGAISETPVASYAQARLARLPTQRG
jgi:DNA-binding transcriptional MerR regulator